ncbi:fungal-specific transcription factor domain-containing protein [Mycena rosella]|uniref:Fungal-specific transcription factor domain-containing protein n=1 Tax=Mycena rosella TaxID=1033263 RepID=A0AAD7G6D1_MYCRO|nr:fungal-specific transcription factor domain-containing protein [Mycena rosella]
MCGDDKGISVSGLGKLRRQRRSCDSCHQRKTRCDGPIPDGCSNCLAFGSPCTYLQPTRKRGPKDKLVEELRRTVACLETKLRALSICSLCAQPLKVQEKAGSVFSQEDVAIPVPTDAEHPLAEDDFAHVELADRFNTLALKNGFFGASSSFALVNSAIQVKEQFLGRPTTQHSRRPRFWDMLPWEKEEYDQQPQYAYPESDLVASLLDLYFTNVHPIIPVLHRPSFERSVEEGVHLKDLQFGRTLLVILGVASRYSDDPRVFVEGDASLSAGWKFVKQVQVVRKFFEPTLYDVQFYCLMALFSIGTSAPQTSWMYIALGMRCLQHRGEHRRKSKDAKWDPSHELWKRAFWSLCSLDRVMCVFAGRPPGIHTEDYDVELPLEVDDEYLEHGFTQPAGKPSLLSYFVCHVRLCEILGDALRRLYASRKSKGLMGWSGSEWEQRVVAELDSDMNEWLDTVPPHLRWDPERRPDAFLDQSAGLYATYYHTQITIHRQYIHKETGFSPSLSICTSAARSALHVADVWLQKFRRQPLPSLINAVFVSGVILLLNIFGSKRVGVSIDKNPDVARVRTAMSFLKFAEARWQPAGRIWELLQELHSLDGHLCLKSPPIHAAEPGASNAAVAEPITTSSQHKFSTNHTEPFAPPPDRPWNNMHPSRLPLSNNPNLSIEQLLADTAEYDTLLLDPPLNSAASGDASGLANTHMLDDEFMSLWAAAPIDFTAQSLGEWDAYIATTM